MTIFSVLVRKELLVLRRNRWLAAGAWVSGLLAAAVVFGTAAVGGSLVWRDFPTVSAALAALMMYVTPLMAVLAVSDAFAAEREQGTLLLMLTYPMKRSVWGLAKLAAYAAAIAAALVPAVLTLAALRAALPLPWGWGETAAGLAKLYFAAWLYGTGFAAMGCVVSLGAATKAQSLARLLLFWLVIVFLWDLALLTGAVATAGEAPRWLFSGLMTINAADAFRLLLTPARAADIAVPAALLWAVLLAWVAAGAGATLFRLARLKL